MEWIRGDYGIADSTLNRFFALHVVAVPLALLLLVVLHLVALRRTGSNNPDGIEIKAKLGPDGHPLDGIPFHPYYSVKDSFGISVFLVIFAVVVFFAPTLGGYFLEHANFEPTDIFSTPDPITPSWYFTPYYAILRAVPDQRMGALLMALSLVCFLLLPWLDRSPVKSIRYKGPLSKAFLALFTVSFLGLMYLGLQEPAGIYVTLGRLATRWLLRLLHTDAVLYPDGKVQASARSREVPGPCLAFSARDTHCGVSGLAALLLVTASIAWGADASAPAMSAPDATASAPAAAPGSVQAAMALAAKVAQQQVADKKQKDEEERLRGFGADWQSWSPDNSVADVASLQRGAARLHRLLPRLPLAEVPALLAHGHDLQIPPDQLQEYLLPAGGKASDYVTTPDAGRRCADLVRQGAAGSVADRALARHRLPLPVPEDFYSDPSRPTGANNLELASVAMPHVLSSSRASRRRCSRPWTKSRCSTISCRFPRAA